MNGRNNMQEHPTHNMQYPLYSLGIAIHAVSKVSTTP